MQSRTPRPSKRGAEAIDKSGHVRYESHTNAPEFSRPEIGVYELELAGVDLSAVDRLVAPQALDPLPSARLLGRAVAELQGRALRRDPRRLPQ